MGSLSRSRRWIALGAFALATLTLSACARTVATSASDRPTPARPASSERSPSDSEYPPISVDVSSGDSRDEGVAGEPERAEAKPGSSLIVIDQYPPNPRCYAAGHYIPAPPLCPGP